MTSRRRVSVAADVSDCSSSSLCGAHGTCQQLTGSYQCQCQAGYTGTNCDTGEYETWPFLACCLSVYIRRSMQSVTFSSWPSLTFAHERKLYVLALPTLTALGRRL